MQRKVVTGTVLTLLLIGMLTLTFCLHQVKAEPPLGIISYWKFDEGSGTTAYDSVGANNGTVYGATWTTGKVDGALSFDGINDYVNVTDDSSITITGEITISAWLRFNTLTGNHFLIDKRPNSGFSGYFIRQTGDEIRFVHGNSGHDLTTSSNLFISTGVWYHLVVVDNLSEIRVYVDGVKKENTSVSGAPANSGDLKIGISESLSQPFNGTIDEVRIYNRALSSEEILQDYDPLHPNITDVSQIPLENNVLPEYKVKVNATVTDDLSGVKQVTLNYTNGNGTWIIAEMTNLEENIWNATIPAFPYCTNVTYVIVAEDNANNTITTEEMGYTYQYHVIPEFPSFLILPLFMILSLTTVVFTKLKKKKQ